MSLILRKLTTIIAAALLFAASPLLPAQSNTSGGSAPAGDRGEIVQDVIEELRASGALQEAVEEGIREFIRQQRQAQAEAQRQQRQQANRKAQNVRPVSAERDHIYGNPDAVVSLIEYSDFECPYCKRFHPTAKELVEQSDGKVNLVYRHFPLDFHNPGAQKQAEASECVAELGGNDAFWAFSDEIYERTKSGGSGFPLDQLPALAEEIGVDRAEFEECYESGKYADRVQEDMAEGVQAGVTGTPGNILLHNETGEALMRAGAQPLGAMQEAVRTLMQNGGDEAS